jgi:hypothetical protein
VESGSGPGGRRFKSSLPDQSFQAVERYFWFSVYIDGDELVGGRVFPDFQLGFHRECNPILLQELALLFQVGHQCKVILISTILLAADGPISLPINRHTDKCCFADRTGVRVVSRL